MLKKIFRLLDVDVEENGIGEVNIASFNVILDDDNVVQPDLFFGTKEKQDSIYDKGLGIAPDLIVKILSPSLFFRDTVQNEDEYERYSTGEYWIADPANKVIEVLTLQARKYQLHAFPAENGVSSSALFANHQINSKSIF